MCGIVGMVRLDGTPADRAAIERMSASIAHRGPDGQGVYVEGPVGLGFRRLAILDLSDAASQPMVSADGRHVLVFNGEIYNFLELREELRQLGHQFRSTGDTEVLLEAFAQWGPACVDRFNGMFAFAIYDRVARTLVMSRDRFGKKPYFYYSNGRVLLFASEIKAILASGHYLGKGTNWRVAMRYLRDGDLDLSQETFFEDIYRLLPGTIRTITLDGTLKEEYRFWSVSHLADAPPEDPSAAFAETFTDAVKIRMRSDVPVGVFLSGGLDSTAILSTIADLRREQGFDGAAGLHAFSYMSKDHDESRYIADTLKLTGATFDEVSLEPQRLWSVLEQVVAYHDEPVHSPTALIGFELSRRAAAAGVKVILNGQGADESLAGYWNYVRAYWTELARAGRLKTLWSEISVYCRMHGRSRQTETKVVFRRILARAARELAGRPPLSASMPALPSWFSIAEMTDAPLHETPRSPTLREATAFSMNMKPLPLYLRVEDRNSMAHGVEVRLPFLDYRLVKLAFSLPAEWKVRGPWNKYVLREAMRGRIPETVRSRIDKMGFPTSGRRWLAHDWYEAVRDLFQSRAVRERGILNTPILLRMLEQHRRGEENFERVLFRAAQFELWAQASDQATLVATPVARTVPRRVAR